MIELAELPERSFNRRFKRATGLAPMDYVHTLRLEVAKQLLEGGDEPVEAVAQQVGYEDAAFFGRLFRRKVGVTPAQYRKRFRGLRRALEQYQERCPENSAGLYCGDGKCTSIHDRRTRHHPPGRGPRRRGERHGAGSDR